MITKKIKELRRYNNNEPTDIEEYIDGEYVDTFISEYRCDCNDSDETMFGYVDSDNKICEGLTTYTTYEETINTHCDQHPYYSIPLGIFHLKDVDSKRNEFELSDKDFFTFNYTLENNPNVDVYNWSDIQNTTLNLNNGNFRYCHIFSVNILSYNSYINTIKPTCPPLLVTYNGGEKKFNMDYERIVIKFDEYNSDFTIEESGFVYSTNDNISIDKLYIQYFNMDFYDDGNNILLGNSELDIYKNNSCWGDDSEVTNTYNICQIINKEDVDYSDEHSYISINNIYSNIGVPTQFPVGLDEKLEKNQHNLQYYSDVINGDFYNSIDSGFINKTIVVNNIGNDEKPALSFRDDYSEYRKIQTISVNERVLHTFNPILLLNVIKMPNLDKFKKSRTTPFQGFNDNTIEFNDYFYNSSEQYFNNSSYTITAPNKLLSLPIVLGRQSISTSNKMYNLQDIDTRYLYNGMGLTNTPSISKLNVGKIYEGEGLRIFNNTAIEHIDLTMQQVPSSLNITSPNIINNLLLLDVDINMEIDNSYTGTNVSLTIYLPINNSKLTSFYITNKQCPTVNIQVSDSSNIYSQTLSDIKFFLRNDELATPTINFLYWDMYGLNLESLENIIPQLRQQNSTTSIYFHPNSIELLTDDLKNILTSKRYSVRDDRLYMYRWLQLPIEDGYICENGDKYYKEIKQYKGKTQPLDAYANIVPNVFQKGALYESSSLDCQ